MSHTANSYQLLIEKLDKFIRKFYTNQLIRGAIFSGTYILAFFIAINLLEYYFYLPSWARKTMFWGFVASSIAALVNWVGVPLLHYYRLGKIISYEQAANIIGVHFAEVRDKLINILQLKQSAGNTDSQLLLAAIDQKSVELKPIDFSFAINLQQNRKYLRFLLPPALLLLFIVLAAPNVIKEGTKRLYHSDTQFEPEVPFQFVIKNELLEAVQFSNFELQMTTTGNARPAEVYIETESMYMKMKSKPDGSFSHEFSNIQKPLQFRFIANGYRSKFYTIKVAAKPVVQHFEISCDYPAYTGKTDETIKNMGDLVVPVGTKITWRFSAANTEQLTIDFGDSATSVKQTGEQQFVHNKTMMQSSMYKVTAYGSESKFSDSSVYSINVVPDLYPVIAVNEKRDSVSDKYFYYIGEVSDDYGLHNLTFNYQLIRADSTTGTTKQMNVSLQAGNASPFTFYWSLKDFGIKPGDKLNYYFEVWDNDGVHGSKATRSNTMIFEMPTLSEMNKEANRENSELKQDLQQSIKEARDLKNQLKDLQDKLQEKKNLGWEDKKNLAENIERQKELQQQIEELKNKMQQNFEKQADYKEVKPEIAEKQKRLQDLMEKTLDDEIKKLMEKLEKMLEDIQKKDALDKMEDMQASDEKMEKELDRMLELFKKLEFDQKLTETTKKLEQLAEKQEELAKQTEKNQDPKTGEAKDQQLQEQLKKQQEQLNKDLKEAQKDVQDLKKLNEETKSNQDFNEAEQSLNNAEKQQQDAQENMDQKKNNSASKSQRSAANNMKNAAQKMSDMKMNMEQEQNAEDMQAIRQLLENIVRLSFDEEKLMDEIKLTNINSPRYVALMKEQQRIRENSKMVEDSLYALAKRQDQIKSFITKEMNNVNKYLGKAIDDLEDRNIIRAMSQQQFVMTGYNNLALMLTEALQMMQQQQSESQSQSQSSQPKNCMKCKKPGNGLPNLSKLQKQLNDKIQQMGEMMKRDGQGQKQGGQGMSKQFAEMAQLQQQIRKELEKINQQENKDGKGTLGNLGEAMKKMEETEKSLVNKQLTSEMLKRQQDILTRLLEAENAQRERDEQPERESRTGKENERRMPPSLEEYLKARKNETELYKTVPPDLNPYYKNITEKYFRNITAPQ